MDGPFFHSASTVRSKSAGWVVPARYFVETLQSVFLAGDVWSQFLPNMLAMLAIGLVFFAVASARTRKTLD